MKTERAFLVCTQQYLFRAGEPAEILGVVFCAPEKLEPRPCYRIRFEDGTEDFIPLSESNHFEIISEQDVRAGRIPEVV